MLKPFSMLGLMLLAVVALAEETKVIELPPPQTQGGMPLMEALKHRKTGREFSKEKLAPQVLSNLLWAAFGVNRPDTGGRTAPSAHNWQEMDLYVALEEGLYLYDATAHALKLIVARDLRARTGLQGFTGEAPVDLVYVADFSKMGVAPMDDRILYSAADTGFISQNVYLFCASEGLATVVRGWVDRSSLGKLMKLEPDQKIILAQTVGYSKR